MSYMLRLVALVVDLCFALLRRDYGANFECYRVGNLSTCTSQKLFTTNTYSIGDGSVIQYRRECLLPNRCHAGVHFSTLCCRGPLPLKVYREKKPDVSRTIPYRRRPSPSKVYREKTAIPYRTVVAPI